MVGAPMDGWRTWRAAMHDALYGPAGFYRGASVPGRHFRTAAHVSPRWADALFELCRRVDDGLGSPDGFTVVDLGAGGGELAGGLARRAPDRWRLVGVDVAPRPAQLPDRVEWSDAPPPSYAGMLLAVEWLDVVPVDVVELTADGLRLVTVAPDGAERLDGPAGEDDARWLERWWTPTEIGDRAEVGRSRDDAWAAAVAGLERGLAVAVDYAAVPARDCAGTLTGYRDGRQSLPVPDGSMDLTAHVLFESCAAAVTADEVRLMSQRDALHSLGVTAGRPPYDGDPQAYLRALSETGEAAELVDPAGLGGFAWLLAAKDISVPIGG
jgi:SAM-dependent MidA family methyltransferase